MGAFVREMNMLLLALLLITLVIFQSCEKATLVVPERGDLSGYWDAQTPCAPRS